MTKKMLIGIICAQYKEHCPIVAIDELPDHTLRFRLDCHKDHKTRKLASGEVVETGVNSCKKLKALFSHITNRPIQMQFRLVDKLPTPEEYVKQMGFDWDVSQSVLKLLRNT